jgi:hypothetical protein
MANLTWPGTNAAWRVPIQMMRIDAALTAIDAAKQ